MINRGLRSFYILRYDFPQFNTSEPLVPRILDNVELEKVDIKDVSIVYLVVKTKWIVQIKILDPFSYSARQLVWATIWCP